MCCKCLIDSVIVWMWFFWKGVINEDAETRYFAPLIMDIMFCGLFECDEPVVDEIGEGVCYVADECGDAVSAKSVYSEDV